MKYQKKFIDYGRMAVKRNTELLFLQDPKKHFVKEVLYRMIHFPELQI